MRMANFLLWILTQVKSCGVGNSKDYRLLTSLSIGSMNLQHAINNAPSLALALSSNGCLVYLFYDETDIISSPPSNHADTDVTPPPPPSIQHHLYCHSLLLLLALLPLLLHLSFILMSMTTHLLPYLTATLMTIVPTHLLLLFLKIVTTKGAILLLNQTNIHQMMTSPQYLFSQYTCVWSKERRPGW